MEVIGNTAIGIRKHGNRKQGNRKCMAKKVPFEIDFFNTEIGNSVYTSGLP